MADPTFIGPLSPDPQHKPAEPVVDQQQKTKERQEPPKPKETKKNDQFHSPDTDLQAQAEKQLKSPANFGRKIPTTQQQEGEPSTFQKQRSLPQSAPENFAKLTRDQFFQQHVQRREIPLYRYLQSRAFPSSSSEPRRAADLRLLYSSRHYPLNSENKKLFRQLIRQEIQEYRKSKSQASDSLRQTAQLQGGSLAEVFFRGERKKRMSEFEAALKESHEGGKQVPKTPSGKTAQFASKSSLEWESFFGNLEKMGSQATLKTANFSELMDALFRGLYQKASSGLGMTLVSDLNFLTENRVVAEKFARILIENPEVLAFLQTMNPGDDLPSDFFSKLGDKLQYVLMTHKPETISAESREANRNQALAQLRNPVNLGAMTRLEQAMFKERQNRALTPEEESKNKLLSEEGKSHLPGIPAYWWGDPRWDKQPRLGKPRLWIYLTYVLGGLTAGIIAYILLRFVI